MSKRYVSLWFPYLATDWFVLKKPELDAVAFVLSTSSHGRLVVAAANPKAAGLGISTGMPVADARALYPSIEVLEEKPTLTTQLLHRIAEWCIRFTPCVAVDEPNGLIIDATGCTHLWGGDANYIQDLQERLKKRGYQSRVAVSDTIGTSWAVARFEKKQFTVDSEKQLEAISHLPCSALRIDAALADKLNKLGLSNVGQLVSMPARALNRRFGKEVSQRIYQALGYEQEFLEPIVPPEPYCDRLPCLEPIVTLTGIEIALQTLLESLCQRLKSDGKGIREACFRGYRVDNIAQGIEISTSRPTHNITHLFHLFSLKLSTIEPALGIELFVLEAPKVDDCQPRQNTMWEDGAGLNDPRLSELFDRLTTRIPDISIERFLPEEHHLPERSIRSSTSLDDPQTGEWQGSKPRPITLLANPQLIEVTAPVPDYPPMNFRCKDKVHKIVRADGPERIEQEWWIKEGEHRDYYAVEDEKGQRFWLFRSGHYDTKRKVEWYLHGYFA